ncbi:hypothetical protein [Methylopila sp. 73B]|uniref:hypothetical protein n=1 Tax=Methylopila sp. 73B TaxID=1120792 RepID=UPI0012DF447A|nr:hypothetical protein [Methylopila sp. 73B]
MTTMTAEYRALTLYSEPPAGCIVFPITREGFEPHLRLGEIAIVDKSDKDLVNGELYVVGVRSPMVPDGVAKHLAQVWAREYRGLDGEPFTGWWWGDLNREGRLRLSEGPMLAEGLARMIVGRVIGLYAPAVEGPKRLAGAAS